MLPRTRGAKKDSFSLPSPLCGSCAPQQNSVAVVCCAEVVSCSPPRERLHAAWPTFSLYVPHVSASLQHSNKFQRGAYVNRWGMQVWKNLTSWLNVIVTVRNCRKLKSYSWRCKPIVPQ